ncbi:MAG TPA: haloacid dehalogenase type II [Burkholderiales bacterium]|jgi:2-haloacid dehalogenase|nr:haloacid dehalogenase type II [Burkholderiales bacterium]
MAAEAMVFDAYGTLFDVHSVAARCETCWPGKGGQLSQLWRAKQLEYTWQRSLMQRYAPFSAVTREALAYACEALGLELDAPRTALLMEEYLKLATYPDVAATLKKLGGRQAILSNGSPDMLLPLVEHSGLRFDALISVDQLRVYKPAPQVYELAANKLNADKSTIGFVSSNCWDAMGAKSFGFKVYWINRAQAPVDRLGFRPDAILRSLDEVLQ